MNKKTRPLPTTLLILGLVYSQSWGSRYLWKRMGQGSCAVSSIEEMMISLLSRIKYYVFKYMTM